MKGFTLNHAHTRPANRCCQVDEAGGGFFVVPGFWRLSKNNPGRRLKCDPPVMALLRFAKESIANRKRGHGYHDFPQAGRERQRRDQGKSALRAKILTKSVDLMHAFVQNRHDTDVTIAKAPVPSTRSSCAPPSRISSASPAHSQGQAPIPERRTSRVFS